MSNGHEQCRTPDGRFAATSFEAVYSEIKRLDQLRAADKETNAFNRAADKEANAKELLATREAAKLALDASQAAIAKAEIAQRRYDEGPPSLQTLQADAAERAGGEGKISTVTLIAAVGLGATVAGTVVGIVVSLLNR